MPNQWATHNFNPHTAGDGFYSLKGGERFQLRASDRVTPIDLRGTELVVEFREASADGTLLQLCTVANGFLTVNDAAAGDIQIESFSLEGWPTGDHPWGLQAHFSGVATPTHLIKGVLPVTDEVVRTT